MKPGEWMRVVSMVLSLLVAPLFVWVWRTEGKVNDILATLKSDIELRVAAKQLHALEQAQMMDDIQALREDKEQDKEQDKKLKRFWKLHSFARKEINKLRVKHELELVEWPPE